MATVNIINIWKSTEVLRAEEEDFSVPRSPPRNFRSAAPPEKGTKIVSVRRNLYNYSVNLIYLIITNTVASY